MRRPNPRVRGGSADRRCQLQVEPLERRDLPATGLPAFLAASGFGVTGKNSTIHATAVATDAVGNTVVTGSFRGTIAFGTTSSSSSLTSNNTQDTFVAKYAASGTLVWVRTFAGQATTSTSGSAGTTTTYAVGQGSAVAVDTSGNIFVGGSFTGTVNFGTTTTTSNLSSPSETEAFLARLDSSGNLVWVRNAVASGGDNAANSLALDSQGGVILAGVFEQSAGFGTINLISSGASDAFVARFDATGAVTWAVGSQGSSGSNAQATGVAVDSAGNIDLTGFEAGTIGLGSGTAPTQLTSAGSDDALIWKLTNAGQLLWGRSFGSTDYDSGGAIAVDSANNLVVVGTFSDTVNFATASAPATLTAGPIFDTFVVKLDPTGQTTWVRGYIGSNGWTKGQAIAVDPFNQIHIVGALNGTADFDPGTRVDSLTSVGSTDAYVAGLDSAGNFVYALQAGQTNFNTALGLSVNAAGAVALAGDYSGSIAFGSISLPSAGLASAFVARLQTQATLVPSSPVLEAGSTTGTTNITSIRAPVFDVLTVDPNSTVRLLRDGVVVAQRVGPGALTDPGPVTQGIHAYSAVAVSLAGVASNPSLATTVTFLITPPAAPTALGLLAADDSATLGDGITNIFSPRITGKVGAGLAVQIVNAAGTVLGSGTAASDGTFTIKLAGLLDGTYAIQAVAIDAAANRSTLSSAFALIILTATPATPGTPALLPADDSWVKGDGGTNVAAPRLTVAAASGTTVAVINAAGVVLGTTPSATSGLTTVAIVAPLADGGYYLRAIVTDAAGNISLPSAAFTLIISTKLPAKVTVASLVASDDSGVKGDSMTTVRRPRITGIASPNTEVDWLNASGAVIASTFSSLTTGAFTLQAPLSFPNGTIPVTLRQIDGFGNVGPSNLVFNLTVRATVGDYFGYSTTDVAIFRKTTNTFYIWNAVQSQLLARVFANTGDVPITGDFFGDGVSDVAVFRPSNGGFYELDPLTGVVAAQQWGTTGDVPVPSDYDGDGKADLAVFRPSNDYFYILDSSTNSVFVRIWGTAGDIPVPGDYFGNGHTDIAVYRPSNSTFYYLDPITGAIGVQTFGTTGDVPVPGDYDGDGKTDLAVFRPSNDTFYVQLSTTGKTLTKAWGTAGDVPVAGDYFGNGRSSFAVYRPSNSTFYADDPVSNATLTMLWGLSTTDEPISPPLTYNFALGAGASAHTSSIAVSSTLTPPASQTIDFIPDLVAASDLPLLSGTIPVTNIKNTPAASLGLERWRPA